MLISAVYAAKLAKRARKKEFDNILYAIEAQIMSRANKGKNDVIIRCDNNFYLNDTIKVLQEKKYHVDCDYETEKIRITW